MTEKGASILFEITVYCILFEIVFVENVILFVKSRRIDDFIFRDSNDFNITILSICLLLEFSLYLISLIYNFLFPITQHHQKLKMTHLRKLRIVFVIL